MDPSPKKVLAAVIAIFLLAFALRIARLPQESPWLDEIYTLSHIQTNSVAAFWNQTPENDLTTLLTPFYYTLLYGWSRLAGTSTLTLRYLSILAGMACIPLVFLLGRRLSGSAAGLLAALCLSCSLPHIYYSQEIRRYVFDTLLVLCSFYSLVRVSEPPTSSSRRPWWIAYFASNTTLLWCATHAVPLFAIQWICLVAVFRKPCFAWITFHAALLAGFAAQARSLNLGQYAWMGPPSLADPVNAFLVLAGGRFSNESPAPYLPLGISLDPLLAVALYLLAGYGCLCLVRQSSPTHGAATALALAAWLFVPIPFWFAFSLLSTPCFIYRYFLFCVPALFLLAGIGWAQLGPPRLRQACLLLLLALFACQLAVRIHGPFRPDYQQAAKLINEDDLEGRTPVLVHKELLNEGPLRYAASFPEGCIRTTWGIGDLNDETRALAMDYPGFWVVMWRWDRQNEYETLLQDLTLRFTKHTLGGMPPLYLYRVTTTNGSPP